LPDRNRRDPASVAQTEAPRHRALRWRLVHKVPAGDRTATVQGRTRAAAALALILI